MKIHFLKSHSTINLVLDDQRTKFLVIFSNFSHRLLLKTTQWWSVNLLHRYVHT